jgi:hypothetical protein
VAHVVKSLGQERAIAVATDAAREAVGDDRRSEKPFSVAARSSAEKLMRFLVSFKR